MIDRCVCHNVTFKKLVNISKKYDISIEQAAKKLELGNKCGMCLPYIELTIKTGRLSHKEIIMSAQEKVLNVLKDMGVTTAEFVRLIPTEEIMTELDGRYDNAMFLASMPRRDEDRDKRPSPVFKYSGNIGCNMCILHAATNMLAQEGLNRINKTENFPAHAIEEDVHEGIKEL